MREWLRWHTPTLDAVDWSIRIHHHSDMYLFWMLFTYPSKLTTTLTCPCSGCFPTRIARNNHHYVMALFWMLLTYPLEFSNTIYWVYWGNSSNEFCTIRATNFSAFQNLIPFWVKLEDLTLLQVLWWHASNLDSGSWATRNALILGAA